MAVTRQQKAAQLTGLKEKFEKAQSVIFTQYIGLKVSEISDLRRRLTAAGAQMCVAKKTLLALATKEVNLPATDEKSLPGPVACIFSYTDPIVGAQVAFAYAKDHKQVDFLGGLFEKKLLSRDAARQLATIPSRQILLAIFAGMIRSPLVGFVSICNSPLTGFARALSESAKKKQPA